MKRFIYIAILVGSLLSLSKAEAHRHEKARAEVLSRSKGFYKEVFMDGGVALTSRHFLPAARFLGVKMDYFASASTKKLTQKDTLLQMNIFCGNENDTNGWLLYPDGAPRFRMIYVNGGKSGSHARSLGEEGRARIQEYIRNGGSYVGTCAGAFIASTGAVKKTGIKNADV